MEAKIERFVDSVAVKAVARLSLGLIIPLSLWGIDILYKANNKMVELQTTIALTSGDRYTGTDARKDLSAMLSLISRNQSDIATNTKRLSDDEKIIYENARR
jgi:hypothetical protein